MSLKAIQLGSVTDLVSGGCWTSTRLSEEIELRAERLAAASIGPGGRVAICHGGSPGFFADLLAVWHVGACAACLPANLTRNELDNVLSFLDPHVSLFDSHQLLSDAPITTAGEPADDPNRTDTLDDSALVLFTSGTTGQPKGVVHSFRSVLSRLALNQAWIDRDERAKALCPLPTHFGHGLIGNCLTPLLDGGDLFLVNGGDVRAAAALGQVIDDNAITFMSSVASLWKIVARTAKPPVGATLKRVHVGSAPLSAEAWRKITDWAGTQNVFNMYGITETANWIGGAPFTPDEPVDGFVGKPWGGQAAVRLENGEIASCGSGEILVQTPSLMAGYLKRPEETDAVFCGGWFATGDLGEVGRDGAIRLLGRQKDEINRAGLKVSPEEIDGLLENNAMVEEACAFGLPDDIAGEIVAVAVSPADDDFDLAALKEWCAQKLVREKCPERWYVTREIPKTDRGKINRRTVAEHCRDLAPA